MRGKGHQPTLTERETQVLRLAGEGLTDKAIGDHLGISKGTVVNYWMRIRLKLGASSRTEAVATYNEGINNHLRAEGNELRSKLNKQQEIEGKLRQHQDELEERVRQRTYELQEINNRLREEIERRNQTERELKASEDRYRNLYNYAEIGMIQSRIDGSEILEINNKLLEILGGTKGDYLGKPSTILWANEEERRKFADQLRQRGRVVDFECHFITLQGTERCCLLSASLFRQEGYIEATILDITDRKLTEINLLDRDRELSVLLTNLPGMAFRCLNDENWTMLYVSEGCKELLGYSPDEMVKDPQFSYNLLVLDSYRQVLNEVIQDAINKRVPYELEYELRTRSGSVKWIWERGRGHFSEDNQLKFIEGYIEDITDRKQHEQQLRFQASLLDQISDMVTATDMHGKIIYANTAICNALSISPDELVGKPLNALYHETTVGMGPDQVVNLTASLGRWEGEFASSRRGHEAFISCRTTLVKDECAQPIGISGVLTEITDRRVLEQNLIRDLERGNLMLNLYENSTNMSDKEVYDYVLDVAVKLTDSEIGFFHLVSEDQENIILTTWNEKALESCTASFDYHYPISQAGNWVDCVREMRPTVYNSFPQSPNRRGLPEGHTPIHRFMSIPVIQQGKVIFIFGVGNKIKEYDDSDIHQIELIAADLQKLAIKRSGDHAIRQSEERYRTLFREMPQGAFIQAADGSLLDANPAALRIFGLTLDQFINRTSYNDEWDVILEDGTFLPGEAHPSMIALRTEQPVYGLVVGIKNQITSERVWVEVNAIPECDLGDIHPSRVIVTMHDITERRKAEEDYSTLFRKMIDAFALHEIICDEEGKPVDYRFLVVNPAFEKLTGLRAEDIIGKTVREVIPSIEQTWIDTYGGVALNGTPVTFDNYTFGLEKFFEVTAYQPAPGYFATIFVDITERKKAEDIQIKYQQELEHRVAERTAQLESANRELESFSYSVSHDLKSPLRALEGFSKILLMDYAAVLDDEGRFYLNRITHAAGTMSELIDGLLCLSRVNRAELNIGPVDLSEIVREVVCDLKDNDPERNVKMIVPRKMKTTADPILVRSVLENLVGNAWKYTSKTKRAVIELGSVNHQDQPVFFIKDNGVGFDMNYSQQLFNAFQRLHDEAHFPGVGIGLATVKRILARHGGRIWAEAEVGKGATFFFTLGTANGEP